MVDDYIWHQAYGIQWRVIDSKNPTFADETRNLRFALSTDGMNPFGNMSSSHIVWLVLLTIYNLPPTMSKSISRGGCRPFVGAVCPAAPTQGSLQIMHL